MKLLFSYLLLFTPLLVPAENSQPQKAPIQSGPTTNQDRFVDFDYCYQALNRHDADKSKKITKKEFLGFCQDFGGNTECLANLSELPIELQAVWNELSCECAQRGEGSNCCIGSNANIPINGVLSGDQTSISQQQFLTQSCLRTDQAIIAYCGPPPIPPIIGPPSGILVIGSDIPWGIIAGAIILLLLLLRRRWFFFPDKLEDDSSSESVDGGAAKLDVQEDVEAPDEDGDMGEADADNGALKTKAEDEEMLGGAAIYNRTVQEPEYESDEEARPKKYQQYDLPEEPEDPFKLRHIEKPPPPPEGEDPYALEHYTPDGGVVSYDRQGEWSYDADGGWTPEEREARKGTDWEHKKYARGVKGASKQVDNRRQRTLEAYGGGEIFDQLEEATPDAGGAAGGGMFDWVIRETLNTLDENAAQLEESTDEEE
jgi:hypothetical protein